MAQKKKPLTREKVLQAAFELVMRDGLEALSMRQVGQALGVEAMSLYNHVEDKAAMLDGLFEVVLSKLPPAPRRSSWRAAVRERAQALRDVLLAHPKLLPLFASRPAVTQASLVHVESVLAVLRDAGFSARASLDTLQVLVTFVVGHALSTAAANEAPRVRYDELDPGTFPRLRELVSVLPSHSADDEFRFGLEVFLDGLEQRLR